MTGQFTGKIPEVRGADLTLVSPLRRRVNADVKSKVPPVLIIRLASFAADIRERASQTPADIGGPVGWKAMISSCAQADCLRKAKSDGNGGEDLNADLGQTCVAKSLQGNGEQASCRSGGVKRISATG